MDDETQTLGHEDQTAATTDFAKTFEDNLDDAFHAVFCDEGIGKATMTNLVSAFQLVAPDGTKVPKKFADVKTGIDRIREAVEKQSLPMQADACLALLSSLAITFPVEQAAELKQQITIEAEKLRASEPKIDALAGDTGGGYPPATGATPARAAAKPGKESKGATKPKTEKAPASAKAKSENMIRMEKLVEALAEAGESGLSIEDLGKKLNCSGLLVRNAIDAARRQKHTILALGKGVFRKG